MVKRHSFIFLSLYSQPPCFYQSLSQYFPRDPRKSHFSLLHVVSLFLPMSSRLAQYSICSSQISCGEGTQGSVITSLFPLVIQILKCQALSKTFLKERIGQIALGPSRYLCLSLLSNKTHAATLLSLNKPLCLYMLICLQVTFSSRGYSLFCEVIVASDHGSESH